jgi:extracellular factor (EF) 3-hydroxypalmitic acid methyl ester biosynthesis protein
MKKSGSFSSFTMFSILAGDKHVLSSGESVSGDSPSEVARAVGRFWRETIPLWQAEGRDVAPLLDAGLARLSQSGLWGPENREPSFAMWQEAGEILQAGWLQLRAREKPRGYAGDHEMLGAIYHNRVTDDPLGAKFDRFFLAQAAPLAVRNRMQLVRDQIIERLSFAKRPQKIVVVGSGSGLEIADALRLIKKDCSLAHELLLLDLDPVALEEAEKKLRPHLHGAKLECRAENLVRLPSRLRNAARLANADLLICTGFFDYLDEVSAAEMLSLFWTSLQPGGRALVFNFAPWNPTRAYMEWIGNWYLIYRTRPDLVQLAEAACIPSANYQISSEATGIDLLLQLDKP